MKRRALLQLLGSSTAWLRASLRATAAEPASPAALDERRLRALAEAVLPGELAADERDAVVAGFLQWHREYRADAEMDHGYGVTRLRRTPPSPFPKYSSQLDALEAAALRHGAAFHALPPDARREVVSAALEAARVRQLPIRPTGEHVASDLMGFYFHGTDANDRAYGAAIRREACRGLTGSDSRPPKPERRR